jgi:hypothetical protein
MAEKKKEARGVIDAAARAASDLATLDVPFALIGGLAVGARAEPRFTRDVDLAVGAADDAEAERVVHAMSARGYRVSTVIEHRRHERLATARLVPAFSEEVFVDLLFASSGIEGEIARAADLLTYRPGQRLPVARVGHLIALKVLSESETRLQDRIDLAMLAKIATEDDWALALEAVRTIRLRQYHRGRALMTRLKRWRTKAAR